MKLAFLLAGRQFYSLSLRKNYLLANTFWVDPYTLSVTNSLSTHNVENWSGVGVEFSLVANILHCTKTAFRKLNGDYLYNENIIDNSHNSLKWSSNYIEQVMRQKYFQTALETKGRKRWKNKIIKEKRDCVQKHYFSSLVSFSLQTKFINRSFSVTIP